MLEMSTLWARRKASLGVARGGGAPVSSYVSRICFGPLSIDDLLLWSCNPDLPIQSSPCWEGRAPNTPTIELEVHHFRGGTHADIAQLIW